MKKIIITLTPSGLMIDANGLALISLNSPEVISEKFFLRIINETKFFCLN